MHFQSIPYHQLTVASRETLQPGTAISDKSENESHLADANSQYLFYSADELMSTVACAYAYYNINNCTNMRSEHAKNLVSLKILNLSDTNILVLIIKCDFKLITDTYLTLQFAPKVKKNSSFVFV